MDEIEYGRDGAMRRASSGGGGREAADRVRRAVDRLREEWSQAHRALAERHARWSKCKDAWRSLHTSCRGFGEWLDVAEKMLADWRTAEEQSGGAESFGVPEAKARQKELEKQVSRVIVCFCFYLLSLFLFLFPQICVIFCVFFLLLFQLLYSPLMVLLWARNLNFFAMCLKFKNKSKIIFGATHDLKTCKSLIILFLLGV